MKFFAGLLVAALALAGVLGDSGFFFNQNQASMSQANINCVVNSGDDWGIARLHTSAGNVCTGCVAFAQRLWASPNIHFVEYEIWARNRNGDTPASLVDEVVATLDANNLPRTRIWLKVDHSNTNNFNCGTSCSSTEKATNAAALLAGARRVIEVHDMEVGIAASDNEWALAIGSADTGQFSPYKLAWINWGGSENYAGWSTSMSASWQDVNAVKPYRQWNGPAGNGLCGQIYYRTYRDGTPATPRQPYCETTGAYIGSPLDTPCPQSYSGRAGANSKGVARCWGETTADVVALNPGWSSGLISKTARTWAVDECPPPPPPPPPPTTTTTDDTTDDTTTTTTTTTTNDDTTDDTTTTTTATATTNDDIPDPPAANHTTSGSDGGDGLIQTASNLPQGMVYAIAAGLGLFAVGILFAVFAARVQDSDDNARNTLMSLYGRDSKGGYKGNRYTAATKSVSGETLAHTRFTRDSDGIALKRLTTSSAVTLESQSAQSVKSSKSKKSKNRMSRSSSASGMSGSRQASPGRRKSGGRHRAQSAQVPSKRLSGISGGTSNSRVSGGTRSSASHSRPKSKSMSSSGYSKSTQRMSGTGYSTATKPMSDAASVKSKKSHKSRKSSSTIEDSYSSSQSRKSGGSRGRSRSKSMKSQKSKKARQGSGDIRLSEGTVSPLENNSGPTINLSDLTTSHLSAGTLSPMNSVEALETRSYQAKRERDLDKKLSKKK